ncbi:hypothetical protein ACFSR7_30715 [Cohnella sp. GCM10020058]|uniref:hypothetical protein n=1 Tax=Cohnella sp. GCM10020058 TaxID=3317330 RepID=UPI003625F00C
MTASPEKETAPAVERYGRTGAAALLRLYLLNGVRSAPHFLDPLKDTLGERLAELGFDVRGSVIFPYDDWHRRLLPQIREARFDIMLPHRRYERSIGGKRALAVLERDRADEGARSSRHEEDRSRTAAVPTDDGGEKRAVNARAAHEEDRMRSAGTPAKEAKLLVHPKEIALFVGHSAGGVAAVHASGLLLAREGGLPSPVVMIGSPKCRIPGPLRDAVLYVQAEGPQKARGAALGSRAAAPSRPEARSASRTADPICRIGSFGGWGKNADRLLPGWHGDRHAPGARAAVRIAGGHADYFRDRAPYISGDGRTNMDETLAAVWPWLTERLAERMR